MESKKLKHTIEQIIETVSSLVPKYMDNIIDKQVSDGNVSLCIMDEFGNVYGKLFGTDKIRIRQTYYTAWTKASQVWITGIATGIYEKKVFNNEIDYKIYGISKPDLIGWEGGQPVTLKDGTKLSIGFSGFRGVTDVEIVTKALEIVESEK